MEGAKEPITAFLAEPAGEDAPDAIHNSSQGADRAAPSLTGRPCVPIGRVGPRPIHGPIRPMNLTVSGSCFG
jgi:hypothetical protein